MITDTIVAQCTPSGTGALALIRLSGSKALFFASQAAQLSSKATLLEALTHTINHGWVIGADGLRLDEVLFFVMHGPKTFTGENTVEISCHNNPFIIENIISRLIECGARLAQPGEFSRQAIENGKLDVLQAEAIKELIHAQSQESLKLSLQQVRGSFSQYIQALEKPMISAIGLCEASFEFLEEDVDFSGQMIELLSSIMQEADRLTTLFDQQKQIREGIRIALIGSVNAGKSSIFNALIGKNRAIVTNIAGTTRDVIESNFYKNGLYWTLIDTAGLRQTEDIIEQQGIERSYEEAKTADIILLIIDGSRTTTEQEQVIYDHIFTSYPEKTILIQNKSDLESNQKLPLTTENLLAISAQTGSGLEILKQAIDTKINSLFNQSCSSFLLNKRQNSLLHSFSIELKNASSLLMTNREYELISLHLQKGLSILSELTGKSITDRAMDAIFKDFCIGK